MFQIKAYVLLNISAMVKKETYRSCRTNQNLACIFCIELIVKLLKRNHQTPPPDMSAPTQQPACLPT